MIAFMMLVIALAILIAIGAVMVLVGGVGFVLAFGDVIICGFIVYLIIRHFIKKKKN